MPQRINPLEALCPCLSRATCPLCSVRAAGAGAPPCRVGGGCLGCALSGAGQPVLPPSFEGRVPYGGAAMQSRAGPSQAIGRAPDRQSLPSGSVRVRRGHRSQHAICLTVPTRYLGDWLNRVRAGAWRTLGAGCYPGLHAPSPQPSGQGPEVLCHSTAPDVAPLAGAPIEGALVYDPIGSRRELAPRHALKRGSRQGRQRRHIPSPERASLFSLPRPLTEALASFSVLG